MVNQVQGEARVDEPCGTARAGTGAVPWFEGDVDHAADAVVRRALWRLGGYACLANVHVVVTAVHDESLRCALAEAWTVFPDGWPVAWIQRRFGKRAVRVAGPDLMPAVIDRGRSRGLRHFLLGATEETLLLLEKRIRTTYPGAQVVGRHAPPFGSLGSTEGDAAVASVAAAKPDIVWCALGAPKQERWMRENAPRLAPALVLGVGAAFDFASGQKQRAPGWVQRVGLEWLHRLLSEPRRLGRRYLGTNLGFVALVLGSTFGGRRLRDVVVGSSEGEMA